MFKKKLFANEQGFTLIELMIVIAILGILAAIAIPRVIGVLQSGKLSTEQSNLHIIQTALARYYNSKNSYPTGTSVGSINALITDGDILSNFNWSDGYGQSYVYESSTDSQHYVLMAPGDNTSVTIAGAAPAPPNTTFSGLLSTSVGGNCNFPNGSNYPAYYYGSNSASSGTSGTCIVVFDQ